MSSQPLVYDLENQDGTYDLQPKSLYAGDSYQGQPSVAVTEDEIILAGDSNNVIRVDPDFGVLLSGNLSLSAMPQQVSFGGGYPDRCRWDRVLLCEHRESKRFLLRPG